ncbi:IQ-domain 17 [Abeliophyllum distichum]|uniref:IQ-domain 17 n=1 Tax=Abeliophyllum distichum TaxID=126358 RepID=A0ABD1VSJ4_9LAMI
MIQPNESNAVAMATTQAAAKISRLTRPSILVKEQHPAIVIQTAFRGYLARKALQALTGVVKLQTIVRGHNVRMLAKMTLQCMQSHVCDQRKRLSCEGSLRYMETNLTSTNFDSPEDGLDAVEEIQALIWKAKECSLKRGKTFAHAFSQQMRPLDEDRFSRQQRRA